MSKRNISYIKPEEPNFLKRLKEQVGYKEGPTVDTKREELPTDFVDNLDIPDEQPTVVVLNPGDLTADEAAQAQAQIEKEEAEKPADLTERVVFRKPPSKRENSQESNSDTKEKKSKDSSSSSKKDKKPKNSKPTLSFNEDEDEDEY